MTQHLASTERWIPKDGECTLDDIRPEDHPLFRFILTRNGHNVALFTAIGPCTGARDDRARRFPADDWNIVDRGPFVRGSR
jgi:hypothetical protein